MASGGGIQKQPHAIMFALHLQGHIIPSVSLAIKLASEGFTVTFVNLEFIHHQISASLNQPPEIDIFSDARKSGLDILYRTIGDGFPVEFNRYVNFDQFMESYLHDFPSKVDEFIGEIVSSSRCLSYDYFLVADTFCFWAAEIADKYAMVNVSLWTEPALVFCLYYHLGILRENGHVPTNGQRGEVDYIPGIKSINMKDFMSYLHDSDSTLLHKVIFDSFDSVKRADFVLCNTVEQLEVEVISALQKYQPFYPIGPLFPADSSKFSVPRSLLPESDCTEWLKGRATGSVLYISFGSLATAEKSVILEIAGGLLIREVSFIWAIRPGIVGSDESGILPDGFKDRTSHRGLVVPWCKQYEVLSNPAVGGFLTHCGWNSVLESIWFGVPMLCYPLFTDQITNRKLVVDDWRIGLNLCDGQSITREEVGAKMGILMDDKTSCELRQEIKKLGKIMHAAWIKEGSSERNFDHFVKAVKEKVLRNSRNIKLKGELNFESLQLHDQDDKNLRPVS